MDVRVVPDPLGGGPRRHDGPQVAVAPALPPDGRVPLAWVPALERFDEVWVRDRAHADACERAGVASARLRVVPPGDAEARDAAREAVAARWAALAGSGRELVLRGPFGRHSSLALVNDELLRGLEAGGRRVRPRHHVLPDPHDGSRAPVLGHAWPPPLDPHGLGPAAAVLPWEVAHPPVAWVEAARRQLDRVVVPSAYVRDGFVEAGMPPGVVAVVPNGVDLARFTPDGPALALPVPARPSRPSAPSPAARPSDPAARPSAPARPSDPARPSRVFLFVGGTIWRKGVDLLLAAWRRAFGPADDVLLVVKDFGTDSHYGGQTAVDAIAALAADPAAAPVLHLTEHLAPADLPALYRAADVVVLPYRGEGFCLPALEAMACGRPVVHPDHGPTTEFVGAGGVTVPARPVELGGRAGGLDFAGPGRVHEVDVDALAETLRALATDSTLAARGRTARTLAEGYGWDAAAQKLEAVLAGLEAERDAVPLARHVAPAPVASPRGTTVLYAPDWDDEPVWSAALAGWCAHVDPDAPVTLVLPLPEARADALLAALEARLAEPLPDLALHPAGPDALPGMVAAADAVLLDAHQAADPPAALTRRAARVLTPADVAAFAATLAPAPLAA